MFRKATFSFRNSGIASFEDISTYLHTRNKHLYRGVRWRGFVSSRDVSAASAEHRWAWGWEPPSQLLKEDRSVCIVNLSTVIKQCWQWRQHLPNIRPYYAMKCNNDESILRVIKAMGLGVDCASKGEIEQCLKLGVKPTDIIYSHPIKMTSHLHYAKAHGIDLTVFDNEEELIKIATHFPESRLLLRLLLSETKAGSEGVKFGCTPEKAHSILKSARERNLNVVGVWFHSGTGGMKVSRIVEAVHTSKEICDIAEQIGFNIDIIDIGGGFSAETEQDEGTDPFIKVAGPISDHLTATFPGKTYIAEPGRFLVNNAVDLYVQIVGKKVEKGNSGEVVHYYLNDGVFGSFDSALMTGKYDVIHPKPLKSVPGSCEVFETVLWGPSCDDIADCVRRSCSLPQMDVGDWLHFPSVGAYNTVTYSAYNNFLPCSMNYIAEEKDMPFLREALGADHNTVVLSH